MCPKDTFSFAAGFLGSYSGVIYSLELNTQTGRPLESGYIKKLHFTAKTGIQVDLALMPDQNKLILANASGDAPGVNNDWPSDISFVLNDIPLGYWTFPGDFGDVKGIFTPDWWFPNWNQYGLLKMLVINRRGTFVDGLKISDVSLQQFHLDYKSSIRFWMEVREDAIHVGGLTLFGNRFGNYGQRSRVRIRYNPMENVPSQEVAGK